MFVGVGRSMNQSQRKSNGIRRVTLAEVAALAAVSQATASQVLNNRENCWASEATRKRVFDAADKLGYRPNIAARGLRHGQTRVMGLVTTGLFIGVRRSRINGFEDAAAAAGYGVMVNLHMNSPEEEDEYIRRQIDRQVDGLAIYPSETGTHKELRRLAAQGFPVVTFDGAGRLDFPCDDVSPDYEQAGQLQAEHILKLGRRRICIASTQPSAWINRIRDAAVERTMREAGAEAPVYLQVPYSAAEELPPVEAIEEPVREFVIRHAGRFDAVVAFDSIAVTVIRILLEQGVRVPDDVAVISAGNTILSSFSILPLTGVDIRNEQIGRQAFGLMMERRGEHPREQVRHVIVQPELVVRESTVTCPDGWEVQLRSRVRGTADAGREDGTGVADSGGARTGSDGPRGAWQG